MAGDGSVSAQRRYYHRATVAYDYRGRLSSYRLLSNDHPAPVTVHYRFYWYSVLGLDVIPFAASRTLIVPPIGEARVQAVNVNLEAKHIRLYLSLQ
ncbi:hypothetical protein CE195_08465 [Sodalis-like symbiont of Philaenus spumarius]|nr:hypothetical protein CE195_08465 [Sodalis-like symbiont of Philaenus spumarius]